MMLCGHDIVPWARYLIFGMMLCLWYDAVSHKGKISSLWHDVVSLVMMMCLWHDVVSLA